MPSNDTLELYAGTARTFDFKMSPPEDITGWTLEFNLLIGGSRITKAATITNPGAGEFRVSFTRNDTKTRAPGTYLYDVWRTNAGAEDVKAFGLFRLRPSVRAQT